MVKIMENPIKMDDLGGTPLFLETSIRKYHRKGPPFFWSEDDFPNFPFAGTCDHSLPVEGTLL